MQKFRRFAILPVAMLVLAACQGDNSGGSAGASGNGGDGDTICASYEGDDYLGRICEAGVIRGFTDPEYPPQSFLDPDTNELAGFDVDVTKAIAERLGVDVDFETPGFDAMVAGGWADRFDISVGSVTITPQRAEALDFTQPYYFTPAQLIALSESGFTSIDDFNGTTICVGAETTYFHWLEGDLELPDEAGDIAEAPDAEVTTLDTDTDCAESWIAGRRDFEGWLTALPTAVGIQEDGRIEIDLVGDPVFYEPIAVAFDKSVEDNDSLVETVDQIIGEMHEDGTLTSLSEKWYDGIDYTTQE